MQQPAQGLAQHLQVQMPQWSASVAVGPYEMALCFVLR
jgi:hypothetical protein